MGGPWLVTGASGFLGEHALRAVAATGAQAVGTFWGHPVEVPRADVVPVDLTDAGLVDRLIRDLKPRRVLHCAALTDVAACEADPDQARRSNIDATRHLVAAIGRHVPDAWLGQLSTDLVFDGEAAPYHEGSAPAPLSVYGRTKLAAEAEALAHPGGCVVRAALMWGPSTTHRGSFVEWMRATLAAGQPLTLFTDEVRTPVHVDDVIEALMGLSQLGATGVWHAGGPQAITRLEMGARFCAATGADASLLRGRRLAESTYAAPRPRDVSMSSAKLMSALGWQPRPFDGVA